MKDFSYKRHRKVTKTNDSETVEEQVTIEFDFKNAPKWLLERVLQLLPFKVPGKLPPDDLEQIE